MVVIKWHRIFWLLFPMLSLFRTQVLKCESTYDIPYKWNRKTRQNKISADLRNELRVLNSPDCSFSFKRHISMSPRVTPSTNLRLIYRFNSKEIQYSSSKRNSFICTQYTFMNTISNSSEYFFARIHFDNEKKQLKIM